MVRHTRHIRASPAWLQFEQEFRGAIEPILGRRITSGELTERIAFWVRERDVIGLTRRDLERLSRADRRRIL